MKVCNIKNLIVSDTADMLFITEYDKEGYALRSYWVNSEDLVECKGKDEPTKLTPMSYW